MTRNRPPGTNGQAAAAEERGKDSHFRFGRSAGASQGPALRLICTTETVYRAHKNAAGLVEAHRLGLIGDYTHLRLALRAAERIRKAEGEL